MRFLFRLVLKYVGLVGWLLMATCNAAGIKPVSYHSAIFNIYSKVNTLASFHAKRSALENPRETIVKGSYTATEDSLSLVPDGPPRRSGVDGVDAETFIRQQFEVAGLEASCDSVVTVMASEFLGTSFCLRVVTSCYVLDGDLLTLSTETREIFPSRVPETTTRGIWN